MAELRAALVHEGMRLLRAVGWVAFGVLLALVLGASVLDMLRGRP